jgi:hypothetical protein
VKKYILIRKSIFFLFVFIPSVSSVANAQDDDALCDLNFVHNRDLNISVSPAGRELDELETFFLQQMERDTEVVAYLQTDVDGYLTAHEELNREEAEVIDGLNVARLQIVAWSRAHQAMAHGAKEPGKWLKVAMDAAIATQPVR